MSPIVFIQPTIKVTTLIDISHRNEVRIGERIKKIILKNKEKLIKGIPELDIKPLDPLHVSNLTMRHPGLSLNLKDVDITGLKTSMIENIRFEDLNVTFTIKTKTIEINCCYEVEGKIFVLPFAGKGEANIHLTNVLTKGIAKLEKYEKKGKTYIRFQCIDLKIEPKNADLYFSNSLSNIKDIDDAVNAMINNNWKDIYSAYRQLPEEALGDVFKNFSNRLLQLYAFDELLAE